MMAPVSTSAAAVSAWGHLLAHACWLLVGCALGVSVMAWLQVSRDEPDEDESEWMAGYNLGLLIGKASSTFTGSHETPVIPMRPTWPLPHSLREPS